MPVSRLCDCYSWPFVRAFDLGVVGCGWVWLTLAAHVSRLRREGWRILDPARDGRVIAFQEYAPQAAQER